MVKIYEAADQFSRTLDLLTLIGAGALLGLLGYIVYDSYFRKQDTGYGHGDSDYGDRNPIDNGDYDKPPVKKKIDM